MGDKDGDTPSVLGLVRRWLPAGLVCLYCAAFGSTPASAQTFSYAYGGFRLGCTAGACGLVCPNGADFAFNTSQGESVIVAGALAACFPSVQNVGHATAQASQVSLGAVNTHITNVRDSVEQRLQSAGVSRPLGFAGDTSADVAIGTPFAKVDASFNTLDNKLDGLLAYADPKSPMLTKAPPPAAPSYTWAVWSQGFVDYENRTGTFLGTDIGRDTTTGGGLAGVDVTKLHLTSGSDAGVLGFLTGETSAFVRNADGTTARINGPSAGVYGVYVNGGFSVDGTFKMDFLGISDSAAANFNLINYTESGNVSYKREMGSWWFEPTIGVSNVNTVWSAGSAPMFTNGDDVRVTGGVRWGTGWDSGGIHYDGTLSTFLYDDVSITGGTVATAVGTPLAPTGEGLIFGQLIGKLEATITKNWSAYAEGEVRGSTDVFGVAGRVGARYTFN